MNDLTCPFCGNVNGFFEVVGTVMISNCEYKVIICPRCGQQFTTPSWMVKGCVTCGEFIIATVFIFLVFGVLFYIVTC
jgi:hypothetical protein